MATGLVFSVTRLGPRRSSPFRLTFIPGFLINEVPVAAFGVLVASTVLAIDQSGVGALGFWPGFGLAVLVSIGLVVVTPRALRTGAAVDRALREGLGGDGHAVRPRGGRQLARSLFLPLAVRPRGVERIRNVRYSDGGRGNLLDVYRNRSHPTGGPTLIYLHGGAFRFGSKNRGARYLFHRLAAQGWVCVSANYRLDPAATFPDQLIDVKRVISWVRDHGQEYGADPAVVFVSGGSSGAHLAALAALTPGDPAFQPGFESADTSVAAAICLYGYYGPIGSDGRPSSPAAYIGTDAPPFFLAHGDRDTLVIVEDARHFAEELRRKSSSPVVYAELPGAQHTFDRFQTLRFEVVVDGIEAFAAWAMRDRSQPVL